MRTFLISALLVGVVVSTSMSAHHGSAAFDVGKKLELKGTVSGLTGTALSFQFTVNGTTVKGDITTRFESGDDDVADSRDSSGSFANLKNGAQVEVKGTRNTDNSVQAEKIEIDNENENDDDDVNEARMEGTLGAVLGTCPTIASSVAGTKFVTTSSTRFDNACSSFALGQRVEVRGTRIGDGSIVATRLRKR